MEICCGSIQSLQSLKTRSLYKAASAAGRYAWKQGMRVSDLIPSRESLAAANTRNRANTSPDHPKHQFGLSPADPSSDPAADPYGEAGASQPGDMHKDQFGIFSTARDAKLDPDRPDNAAADVADDVGKE